MLSNRHGPWGRKPDTSDACVYVEHSNQSSPPPLLLLLIVGACAHACFAVHIATRC